MKHFFVLTGPESTGKTTLAQQLAVEWNMPLVPEFARQYLENKVDSYTLEDVDFIGQKQWELELATEGELVICDTDLLTIYIWKKERFSMLRIQPYFHCSKDVQAILTFAANIPWVPDPLRENPMDRDRLFEIYLSLINKLNCHFPSSMAIHLMKDTLAYHSMEPSLVNKLLQQPLIKTWFHKPALFRSLSSASYQTESLTESSSINLIVNPFTSLS